MSNGSYFLEETKLPYNFADSVLYLEIKVDSEECDLVTIQRLNELYRVAIEYYITFDQKKSAHFQKKLTQLLTSPTTLRLIDTGKPKPLQKVSSQAKLQLQPETIKLTKYLERFKSQPKDYVKSILDSNEKKVQQTENLIREGITKQQDSIKNRVLERARSRKNL